MGPLKHQKHERFCQEYLIDLNATQAYLRTGYKPQKDESAAESASRLLRTVKVRARIDELMAERSKRTGVTADRVVRELARIGFVNATDVINMADATVKTDAEADDVAAIASVKVKETFGDYPSIEREVKLYDKLKALEMLGRHLGMFQDNVNLNVALPRIVDDIGGVPDG